MPEHATKDLRALSTFVHGYHNAAGYTLTLEHALQIAEKENIHSSRSGTLRAMKAIYDWIISPTRENLSSVLCAIEETESEFFNGIYAFWEKYSPVLLDFGPILLKHKLSHVLERSTKKEQITDITQKIFSYPDKKLHDDALTQLASWQKKTNA
jgi:hypothetical protein